MPSSAATSGSRRGLRLAARVPRSIAFTRTQVRLYSKYETSSFTPYGPPRAPSFSQYGKTRDNLKLQKDTPIIIQGFTGRQGTFDAQHSLAYGTNIVGGIRPGKDGEHLGKPVFPNVRAAMDAVKPHATAVYVAAGQAKGAILEAIEAEVPLVVAVAEHIPLHDMLYLQQVLQTQSKTRLLGANTPGMINPHAKCRIGFPPIPFYKPGSIAIAAKSGTLSYETVASTTRAGLGQSLAIGIGGDPIPGTDFVDCLEVFEQDENTEGIIIVGEVGGFAEEHAAEWIKDYRKRVSNPKPIMALIGGVNAVPGRIMGHSGMWNNIGEPSAQDKKKTLADAGCTVVDHPAQFGEVMKGLLAGKRPTPSGPGSVTASQNRGLHTLARRLPRHHPARATSSPRQPQQKRNIWLTSEQSLEQFDKYTVPIGNSAPNAGAKTFRFAISLDRVQRQLRLVGWTSDGAAREIPFSASLLSTSHAQFAALATQLISQLGVPKEHQAELITALHDVRRLYTDLEAISVYFTVSNAGQTPEIVDAHVQLDDAAFKSSKRVAAVHKTRRVDLEDADEVAAEKYGIVYVKLDGEGSIGTVVNGAGLAMNLVDAIEARGGSCANFLDTGGKATQETVKASFESVLKDERVKVVFVNIFGGLTLCDMIANGVLLAYKDLGISLPVVVRLRGTNEAEGQKIIADSGLPMFAFDDFEEAAQKCIELAKGSKGVD